MRVLAVNAGSSSLRAALFELSENAALAQPGDALWSACVRWGSLPARADLEWTFAGGSRRRTVRLESAGAAADALIAAFAANSPTKRRAPEADVVAHRVLHAGAALREPALVTTSVKATIRRHLAYAPENNRAALSAMAAARRELGNVVQVAVFDSGFHATIGEAAAAYPGPYAWRERLGLRRIGFFGESHRYAAARAAQMLDTGPAPLRVVACHLGRSTSLAAVAGGISRDTTMGYTPLEGPMMAASAGSIDPGLLLHFAGERYGPERLRRVLADESGLRGLSGIAAGALEVERAAAAGDARASLALEVYAHRLRAAVAAMAAAMDGVDVLTFSGGIGEHSARTRAAACRGLGFLGIRLDDGANAAAAGDAEVGAAGAAARVLVVRAQEEWAVACAARRLLHGGLG